MPKYLDQDGVVYLWRRLKGDLSDRMIYRSKTKEQWDVQDKYAISEKDVLYVYSDYKVIQKDGEQFFVPGIKIGDGTTYLIDLPFISSHSDDFENMLLDHIRDSSIHVSANEKAFWNNKLNLDYSLVDDETLTFNRL